MGIEYDLISDSARVGYELGKGPCGDEEFSELLKSGNVEDLERFIAEEESGFPADYIRDIVVKIVEFAAKYKDWRVINDCSSDISVVSNEQKAEILESFGDDPSFPLYERVGSRYRK